MHFVVAYYVDLHYIMFIRTESIDVLNIKDHVMKIEFEFEFDTKVSFTNNYGDTVTGADAVHEALCLAIHEKDVKARNWLYNNIIDIATKG